jgi:hypothetical protein
VAHGAREVGSFRSWMDDGLTPPGNMPHLMPSGQDFFTQLKKQLVTIDQGKPSQ